MYEHTRQFPLLALLGGALLGGGAASAPTPLPGGSIPKYVEPVYVPPVIDATTGRGHKLVMSEIERPYFVSW
jgi:hypothetical protein